MQTLDIFRISIFKELLLTDMVAIGDTVIDWLITNVVLTDTFNVIHFIEQS